MRLLLQDNIGSHYRKAIFMLMDKELHCEFCFGDKWDDIKKVEYSALNGKVTELHNVFFPHGYYQKGMMKMMRANYDNYILCGDLRCLSVWAALLYSRFNRKKKVYIWTHGWYGKESWLQKVFKKIFLRLPTGGVFLYGNYARKLMIKEGFDPQKLFVIHNSLDYDKQISIRNTLKQSYVYDEHFGNKNPNLFFIGRLKPVKKLDMILYAMALLKKRNVACNMTFIGDGTESESLKTLARELGLEKDVWFYGACYDEKQLGELIYNADLCVAPGNIGLTAMHTLVFGTPALTHDDFPHQMPEFEAIRDGETGIFFKRDDLNSLANSIEHWIKEKVNIRDEVRKACMNEIDTSWTPQFQLNIFKEVLNV